MGIKKGNLNRQRRAGVGIVVLALSAIVVAAVLVSTSDAASQPAKKKPKVPKNRSVVILNGDGMGPAQRTFIQYVLYGTNHRQPMDSLPHNGWVYTHSADDAFVTDSAAGATAWSTGRKTINGHTAVDPDGKPMRTILEKAHAAGKTTMLVGDHDVTNATLAAFGAHQTRSDKVAIAKDYLDKTHPDVLFGGGQKYWYPVGQDGPVEGEPSKGTEDLVEVAKSKGYRYVYDRKTFDNLKVEKGMKALALVRDDPLMRCAAVEGYDLKSDPYYVPTHMLIKKALDIGSLNPNGFFMAIDIDELDDAGHEHNGPLMLRAGAELNRCVEVLKKFQARHPETLIIVLADHECGCMTIEDKDDGGAGVPPDDPVPYYDPDNATNVQVGDELPPDSGPFMVKDTQQWFTLDWTSAEHGGVTTQVSAKGPNARMLQGFHDNTYVYKVMHRTLFGK